MHIAPSNKFTLTALVVVGAGVFFALVFGAGGSLRGQVSPKTRPPTINLKEVMIRPSGQTLVRYDIQVNSTMFFVAQGVEGFLGDSKKGKRDSRASFRPIAGVNQSVNIPYGNFNGQLRVGMSVKLCNQNVSLCTGFVQVTNDKRFCNIAMPENVNNDYDNNRKGIIDQKDIDELANYVDKVGPSPLYPDVSCDGNVNPTDVNMVITKVKGAPKPNPEGEASNTNWQNGPRHKDVNNDGVVNKEDAVDLQEYIESGALKDVPKVIKKVGGYTPYPPYPDVNGDGKVAPDDWNIINNWLLNPNNAGKPKPKPEGESNGRHNYAFPADVNNDGWANKDDGTAVLNYMTSKPPLPRYPDANNDNAVNTKDYTFVTEPSRWQNPNNAHDVNNDGVVSQKDIDVLQRYVDNAFKPKVVNLLLNAPSASAYYPDVNGDRHINATDVLQVINKKP